MPAGFPESLLGPGGALIGAVAVIVGLIRIIATLWKEHLADTEADRRRADDNFQLARDAVDGLNRLAKVEEDRERRESARAKAARSRKDDP